MAKKEVKFDITAKDKTKTAFSSALKGATSLRSAVGKVGVPALAGAAAIGGLVLFAKKAISVADTIAKTADQIGISTTALQEYRYASELAGVEAGALDTSFRKFTRTLGELRAGTGAAVTYLQKFSPELIKQFRATKNADDALELFFDTLGGVANQSDRAALAAAFFGRKGAELTLLVKSGSAALKEQRDRAHDLGQVLEEDLLRGAEKTNDQLTILANTISTNLYRAILSITPELGDMAERMAEGIPKLVKWVDEFAQFIGLIQQSRFDKLDELNAKLDTFYEKLNRKGSTRYFKELHGAEVAKLEAERDELEALILYQDKRTNETFGGRKKQPAATPTTGGGNPAAADVAEARKKALDEERILTAALVKEMNAWKAAEDATTAARETANQKRIDQNSSVQDALKSMREENLLLGIQLDGREGMAATLRAEMQLRDQIGRELLPAERQELEKLVLEQEKLTKEIENSGDGWKEVQDVGLGAIQSLQGGVEGLFSYMLSNLDQIINMVLELNNASSSSGGIGGLFGGLGDLFVGMFGGGSMSSGSTDFMPSNTGGFQFPQFASGGSFMVGGQGGTDNNLVAFKASGDERVTIDTPAQQRARNSLSRGGGGVVNNYNFDNRGAYPESIADIKRDIAAVNKSIPRQSIAAVDDAARRNKMPGLGK